MFYTMNEPSSVEVKDKGFIFHFNYKDVHYYEDGVIRTKGVEPTGLIEFYPTNTDTAALLKEYQSWCKEFSQVEDEGLTSALTSTEYYKNAKLRQLSDIASEFEYNLNKEMYFTSSLGFRCNGDRRTRDNLQDLASFFESQQHEGYIKYRDYDNVDRNLTKGNLITLLGELAANGQGLYNQKWSKQKQIKEAQDFDTLNKISLEFEMMSFIGDTATGFMLDPTPLAYAK